MMAIPPARPATAASRPEARHPSIDADGAVVPMPGFGDGIPRRKSPVRRAMHPVWSFGKGIIKAIRAWLRRCSCFPAQCEALVHQPGTGRPLLRCVDDRPAFPTCKRHAVQDRAPPLAVRADKPRPLATEPLTRPGDLDFGLAPIAPDQQSAAVTHGDENDREIRDAASPPFPPAALAGPQPATTFEVADIKLRI